MKWVNIGDVEEFDYHTDAWETIKSNTSNTGKALHNYKARKGTIRKHLTESVEEVWVSFDIKVLNDIKAGVGVVRIGFTDINGDNVYLLCTDSMKTPYFTVCKSSHTSSDFQDTEVYNPDITLDFREMSNIELHIKSGESASRIDVWVNHKLKFSYRAPDLITASIKKFFISFAGSYPPEVELSSFILQDTRRIGYEKFVKLNIDPATEQNMPQGSTTTYTLSGLTDSSEYSDITGVVAVLQATSRDANISTGTYTLNGAKIGTIDVSDSSGRAYETTHAETNSVTGLPFTRDDIEGQTLSFTVNGAE